MIWIILITAGILIIIAVSLYITKLNHNLQNAIINSNSELSGRETAEKELLAIKDNLEILIENRTLELMDKNEQLQTSLKTNNDLIREVHHRVKNSLQIIISLMGMQHDYSLSDRRGDFCINMQRKITSISLVHELLFSSEYIESLSSKKLLELMSYRICEMLDYGANEIKVDPDSVDQQISLELAIPLGLIISEIIANSFQYAHKEGDACTTTISLLRQNNSMLLTIKDDGAGFPYDFVPAESGGLGLQLVTVLVDQIKGKIHFYNRDGAVTEIIFPVS